MSNIIEVTKLYKSYGEIEAVKGISFYVERGKLFAFLGPNGAGKSTTIDIICTFLKPDSGEIVVDGSVLGKDDDGIRAVIGAVFQDGLLDPLLTVLENLRVRGGFYGLKGAVLEDAVQKTAILTGITELLKRPYGKLSGGQRRRCDIARALVNRPKNIIFGRTNYRVRPSDPKKYLGDHSDNSKRIGYDDIFDHALYGRGGRGGLCNCDRQWNYCGKRNAHAAQRTICKRQTQAHQQ